MRAIAIQRTVVDAKLASPDDAVVRRTSGLKISQNFGHTALDLGQTAKTAAFAGQDASVAPHSKNWQARSNWEGFASASREIKMRQSAKIRELRTALVGEGFISLDEQAKVLGLSRSTTWAILKGNHKCSGLSAKLIGRMLKAPDLPAAVRTKIFQYVTEKNAGLYGHSTLARRKFIAQLRRELNTHPYGQAAQVGAKA